MTTLNVRKRERTGKGGARALRREGETPAIVYGYKQEEQNIAVNSNELNQLYKAGHFTSKLIELNIDGKALKVIPKDVQKHPVTDEILHADFYTIEGKDQLNVQVKVVFINAEKSPGLKRGGVLNVVRRDVELLCSTSAIPEKLIVDLDNIQIGDSIHISNIDLPEGCTPTITDRDFTIATVVGRVLKSETEAEGEGEEGEEGETAEGEEQAGDSGGDE